ncbi:MAG: hypothetical protein WBO46_07750 [Caldilineaceae bacterium]
MAITFNLAIGQEDTGGEVLVDDTLATGGNVINLRSLANLYATADYYGALVDHGVYTFTAVPEGIYKVYNNATELTIFGQIQIGQYNAVLLTGNQTIAGVKTFSSQPIFDAGISLDSISEKTASAGITFNHKAIINQLRLTQFISAFSMAGYDISGLVTPVGNSSATNKTYVDTAVTTLQTAVAAAYADRTALAADQNIYAQWTFRTTPYSLASSTSPFHVANVKYVKDYVNNYLSGAISTEQQNETLIEINYNGTQEDNRIYTNIAAGLVAADAYADSTTRVQLFISGNGNDDGSLDTNYNLVTTTYDDYIDIVGITQSVIILCNDDTYTATTLGFKIIENVTISTNTTTATPAFTKFIFRNCKFTSSDSLGAYTLTNCIVENCVRQGCTVAYSSCAGEMLDITNSQSIILQTVKDAGGAYEIAYSNGDIRGKRILGRKGADITAAASITLGQGNLFVVNGGTTVTTIVTTDWTEGSIVSMLFPDTPTINVGGDNIVHVDGSFTANGGYLYRFQLLSGSWYIINKY